MKPVDVEFVVIEKVFSTRTLKGFTTWCL